MDFTTLSTALIRSTAKRRAISNVSAIPLNRKYKQAEKANMKLNFRSIFPRDALGHAEALYLYRYAKALQA